MAPEIKLEKFVGPLGLLLQLIEKEEMDITEIALAKIADEFLAYIKSSADLDPEEMADFLVVAAKLLYIKSKALLPYLLSQEVDEEADDLEKQLRMYKEFVSASASIKTMALEKNFLFLPPLTKNRRVNFDFPKFAPPAKISAERLHDQFELIIKNLTRQLAKKLPEATLEPKINIEDRINLIKTLITEKIKVNFSKLLSSAKNKTELIVSFLAVLELAKQRELTFEQAELFSDIHILRRVD